MWLGVGIERSADCRTQCAASDGAFAAAHFVADGRTGGTTNATTNCCIQGRTVCVSCCCNTDSKCQENQGQFHLIHSG
jgi:hypothetical protein